MNPATTAEQESGFMYVEVLASVVLLGFLLLTTAPMFVIAARENAAASDQTFTATSAHDKAEQLKRANYDDLAAGRDEVKLRKQTFDRSWVVADDTPHPGMRTVTVTVTPRRTDPYGKSRIAQITFYRVPSALRR